VLLPQDTIIAKEIDNSFHKIKNEDQNTGSVKASAAMKANICVNCRDPILKKTAR
jgi:hypothetical protein